MSKQNTLTKSQTDWAKINAMTDDEIDYSDIPLMTDEMWENAVPMKNGKPVLKSNQENCPIDRDIIEFFRARSFIYPAKINQLLREYMEAEKAK